jgi:hypothetical protein
MQYSHPFLVGHVLLGGWGNRGNTIMAVNVAWQELYQAALLTLRPEELRQRIDEAEESIRQRIAERRNDSSSGEEWQALDDALRGLRVLASTECKSPRLTPSGSVRSEAI